MKPLFWQRILFGVLCAVGCCFGALCLFAFIGLKLENPASFNTGFANIALFFSAFIGGRIASNGEENRVLCGFVCGMLLMCLVLLPSIILSEFSVFSFIRMVFTVIASVLGAIVLRGSAGYKRGARKRRDVSKKYGSYV